MTTAAEVGGDVWAGIAAQWRERKFDRLRQHLLAVDPGAVAAVDDLLVAEEPPPDPESALGEAFASVAGSPDGPLLLAMYVYARCLWKWERSSDFARIEQVLEALSVAAPHDEPTRLVVDQAQHLVDAMAVDNALQCSCPVQMGYRAKRVVEHVSELAERVPADGNPSGTGPMEVLRSDMRVAQIYFQELAGIADAVLALLMREEPVKGHFDGVIRSLVSAERSPELQGDVYQSELRTHLATVKELNESAESDWLEIDTAELVYVYPFALVGEEADPDTVIERVKREADGWSLGPRGIAPVEVQPMELSDLWEHADPPERTYGGLSVRLPDIAVETTADALLEKMTGVPEAPLEFEAEIRFSRLGNHYLRIRSRLEGADLHELNQALRRGSPSMGEEEITSGGGTWKKLVGSDEDRPGYVQDVLTGIADSLGVQLVGDATADFHVGVGAREVSMPSRADSTGPIPADELLEAAGASLLFRPVGDWATSLEEWVRYPPLDREGVIDAPARAGDLIVRTADTTVLYLPTSPEWVCKEHEEIIEFVAAVPPLMTAWEKRISEHAHALERRLKRLQAVSDDRGGAREEADEVEEAADLTAIHHMEAELHELQADIRNGLADLHSPRLVWNRTTRVLLDRLWDAAGLPLLEAGLDRQLAVIATLQERLAAMAAGIAEGNRRRAEQRQAKFERILEVGLGLIAATSLAGLFDWVNNGFEVQANTVVWLEVAVLLGAATALGALMYKIKKSV